MVGRDVVALAALLVEPEAGFRRRSADRGRGQAAPCSAANLAAIFATAVDRVIAGLVFNGRAAALGSRGAVAGRGLRDLDLQPTVVARAPLLW